MSEFKFVKEDGTELPYTTGYVVVQKPVLTNQRIALYGADGTRISVESLLAEAGLKLKYIPHQSQAYIDFMSVSFMYNAIPEFITRVQELRTMYDFLQIPYDAKTEDVETALNKAFTDINERTEYYASFQAALQNVKINYQAGNRALYEYNNGEIIEADAEFNPVDDFIVWLNFPILVKWLPGNYSQYDIPAKRESEIVADSLREEAIKAELALE